jgi:glycerophosphoryl diester phosphodiesterase
LKSLLNIAHRGASAYERGNTLASIERAMDLGADAVEFDLRRTADGVIVLWHDERIRDREGKTLPISKISFADLDSYSQENGFRLATFEEVLGEFGTKIGFDIEIKTPGFEEDIIQLLRGYPSVIPLMISSYHSAVIRRIKALDPSVKTGLVMRNSPIFKFGIMPLTVIRRYLLRSKANSAHLNLNIASRAIINELTEFGFEIYIWTVNEERDMRRFIALGVDGIITDKPDLLKFLKGAGRNVSLSL